ncbi:carboxypeptidase-like regulatory domain-containing protein, partial [bacterium]|nr:carboxypeptidase-like regulatory domain-containing protein [bacterium]
MRTKFILALLGVALITAAVANVSWSETGTAGIIKGSVMDKRSGQPLPLANIVLERTTMGAATDPEGIFFILDVPQGSYQVRATMMGY